MKQPVLLLLAAASTYMASSLLECTSLIFPTHHDAMRTTAFCYGLLFSLCSVYAMVNLAIVKKKGEENENVAVPHTKAVWWVASHAGAIGFALLGEVPWLSGLALTPGWWGRLPTDGKITIAALVLVLLVLGVRQCVEARKARTCCNKAMAYALFVGTYGAVYVCVLATGAKTVWHVHHAIAAGFLSLCFGNWASTVDVVVHGTCIGVMVEGIAFYGIGECMLFIIEQDTKVTFSAVLVAWTCTLLAGVVGCVLTYVLQRHLNVLLQDNVVVLGLNLT